MQNNLESFFSAYQAIHFKKAEVLLRPDDITDNAYFLKKGNIREYAITPEGIEITIHMFAPNSCFPMSSVISEIPNRYFYEAINNVEVYVAPKEKVQKYLQKNNAELYKLTKRAFTGLDKLTFRLEQIAYGTAHDKIVSSLLFLNKHFGKNKNSKIIFQEKFTHREISAFAGVSRETATRELEKLQKKKILNYKDQIITIQNLAKLKQELK